MCANYKLSNMCRDLFKNKDTNIVGLIVENYKIDFEWVSSCVSCKSQRKQKHGAKPFVVGFARKSESSLK